MNFKYNLNDKLKPFPLLMYGLQWLIVCIPMVVILGSVVANIQHLSVEEEVFYIQRIFILMGLGMLLQVIWGHRMPIVIGPASVLLIGIVASASSSLNAVYTAIFVGGILMALLGFSGFLNKIVRFFTPRIIVVILALIAFTLSPVILNLTLSASGHEVYGLFFAVLLCLAMVVGNNLLKGVWKSTIVIWGLVIGTLLFILLFSQPQEEIRAAGIGENNLSWFLSSLEFDLGTIIAFLFCFVALLINELGSVQVVAKVVNADQLEKRVNRTVGITGIMNILSGVTGTIGPVNFSMSPGIISATGCASRYPMIPAAVGLALCALFPSVILFLIGIPSVVLGAVLLYLMATQLASSYLMVGGSSILENFNQAVTIALPLLIALLVAYVPDSFMDAIPQLLRPILGNGFVMGVIAVMLLEHVAFREKKK